MPRRSGGIEDERFFHLQANWCYQLAWQCFDLAVAHKLNIMGNELTAKPRELWSQERKARQAQKLVEARAYPGRRSGKRSPCQARRRRRRRWTAAAPAPGSAGLFAASLWRRRSTMGPFDSQPAATILQTESARRSTTTDEKKCHPQPHHRPAA